MHCQNRSLFVVALLLMLVVMGCSTRPNDAAIVSQVQSKIAADSGLAGKAVTVQSTDGVVTLSGSVDNEQQRAAAAVHAGTVEGVKTVVNNLQVVPLTAGTEPGARFATGASSAAAAGAMSSSPSALPTSAPAQVTIPEGTVLSVRMIDAIDSEQSKIGDIFRGTLETPIAIDGKTVAAKGADVEGRVIAAKSGGKFAGRPEISLELTQLTLGGKQYHLNTSEFATHGASRGKETAAAVGGGAAVGAIIGGIAGGGKGAAIGAAAGAGAGTGVQAIRKSGQVKVPSESVIEFRLLNPVLVTP